MLSDTLPLEVFAYFLVFVRLGAGLMILPGVGEPYISIRIRIGFAFVLTAVVAPLVGDTLPLMPATPIEMTLLLLSETFIGLFIGAAARFAMAALHIAGTIIAFQTGLGFALFLDPTQGTQGALIATFLNLMGLVLIFVTGLHQLIIMALFDSYILFPPGAVPPVGDFAELFQRYMSDAFLIGIQMAAPFIVYGLIFYISLGVTARLMPQLQVFFIAMPLNITLGLLLFAVVMPASLMWFLGKFEANISQLTAG
jgi:flagellar biosynthetic protein FliR